MKRTPSTPVVEKLRNTGKYEVRPTNIKIVHRPRPERRFLTIAVVVFAMEFLIWGRYCEEWREGLWRQKLLTHENIADYTRRFRKIKS
jgi:hypothetical protein